MGRMPPYHGIIGFIYGTVQIHKGEKRVASVSLPDHIYLVIVQHMNHQSGRFDYNMNI